jgi:hypothetical protein
LEIPNRFTLKSSRFNIDWKRQAKALSGRIVST